MTTTQPSRFAAPLKWHGGKSYLASRIVAMMPPHVHYVEPFFGGGAVLFRKPDRLIENHSEVVNDLYGDLVNFWQVLRSPERFGEFLHLATLTPFAKPTWQDAIECRSDDPTERAVSFFIRYRQSRQGLGRDFATMSRTRTRRGMNEQVSAWLSAVEGLPQAHERLRRVAIFNENALDIIRREDDRQTFFYIDPPYLAQTRVARDAYTFEMTDHDHAQLLEVLGGIRGRFLLSGYPHPLYDSAATRFAWHRTDIQIDNKASAAKTKPQKTECLWSNYDPAPIDTNTDTEADTEADTPTDF